MRHLRQPLSEIEAWPVAKLYRFVDIASELIGLENAKRTVLDGKVDD